MIKNYFTIALRNIVRHKGYAAINIIGLSAGIASSLLLYLIISYELSYDTYHENYKKIYHVVTKDKYSDGESFTSGVPFPALEAIRIDFPQVKAAGILSNYGSQVTINPEEKENKKFMVDILFFTEPEFFNIFDFNWLTGSPQVLKDPGNVVLAKNLAVKYFSDWHKAIGKYIKLDNAVTLKVAGVLEDPPPNSDYPLQIVASFETAKSSAGVYYYSKEWGSTTSNFQVFVLLPQNVSEASVNRQLKVFSKKHYVDKEKESKRENFLQPLKDVHFDSRFSNFTGVTSKAVLWTLALIGFLIIVMACINFINLATAQAITRSREVGIRKVLGGTLAQLRLQILGETAVIVGIATVLALVLASMGLPYLSKLTQHADHLRLFTFQNIGFLLILGIFVTLLSGLYPSFILSGFNPILAMKSKVNSATVGGISLRRALVVLQFIIAQVLIIGIIVSVSQMNFVRKTDLGFDKEGILVMNIRTDSISKARHDAFKHDLLQITGVRNVSFASDVPSSGSNWGTNFAFDGGEDKKFTLFLKFCDEEYFKTYGLKLIAGRPLRKSDTITEGVINETLMNKLGFKKPEDVLGKSIRLSGTKGIWKPIVGVVKDFKTNSLKETVKPLLICAGKNYYGEVGVKLRGENLNKTCSAIQAIWDRYFPEYVYSGSFLDEDIARFYEEDELLAMLYKFFAGLAVLISCMGLYGLVSFMSVQKTKEVGIRKVLGASIGSIVYLFSKEFTILITLAFLVAAPIAYFLMNTWLSDFAFRISIGPGVFVIALIVSMVIAWLTVSYKAMGAALANPVKSLRSE